MKVSMRFDGGQELARRLALLPRSVSRDVQVQALRAAAEPIRDLASALAPKDEQAAPPHLQDNIVIGAVSERSLEARGRQSETVVEVGPALKPDDFFYGYFLEYGTVRHPAQPFLQPAFDSEAPEALEILKDELWFAIKHGVDDFER